MGGYVSAHAGSPDPALTDAEGWAWIGELCPGYYDVTAWAPGYVSQTIQDVYIPEVAGFVIVFLNFSLDTVSIDTDSDNDGDIDAYDDCEEDYSSRIVALNCDDDNGANGVDKAETTSPVANENDLAEVHLYVGSGATGKVVLSHGSNIKVWDSPTKGTGHEVTGDIPVASLPLKMWVEGYNTGVDTITATHYDSSDVLMGTDTVKFKVTPFLLLPNTAPVEKVYVNDVDSSFVSALQSAVGAGKVVALAHGDYPAGGWPFTDVWVQDEVEIGYMKYAPNTGAQVVWDLPRNRELDDWPEDELLGPGFGYIAAGSGNQSGNSGGNLEVTPPVTVGGTEYKYGRAFVGNTMSSSLTDFIAAQEIQIPIIQPNTNWLLVGHVDEVFSFVPWNSSFKVLVADPACAMSLFSSLDKSEVGTASSGGAYTLVHTGAGWTVNEWQGGFIEIIDGTGIDQVRQVASNTSDTITVTRAWTTNPDSTSVYEVVVRSAYRTLFSEGNEDLGIATSATSDTLTDSTKGWTANEWVDGCVRVVAGTNAGHAYRITDNTATQLTIDDSWATIPDATSRYIVVDKTKYDDPWAGDTTPSATTVRELTHDSTNVSFNTNTTAPGCQYYINSMYDSLKTALGLSDSDFIKIPAWFRQSSGKAVAYVPGMVNCLVDGEKVVMAKPFGPKNGGVDVFEAEVNSKLSSLSRYFIDDWRYYHTGDGEVHCGTNTRRTPPTTKWWE